MFRAHGIEIAAAITIPSLAFILNWALRSNLGYELSAAADFALAITSFDLGALVEKNLFAEAMRSPVFKENFNPLMITLFGLTLIAWVTLFLQLEHRVAEGYDLGERRMGAFLLGWGILATFLAAHILAFVYG